MNTEEVKKLIKNLPPEFCTNIQEKCKEYILSGKANRSLFIDMMLDNLENIPSEWFKNQTDDKLEALAKRITNEIRKYLWDEYI